MRKMARVVKIDDVITHLNADSLEIAIIGGWQCVVKKGEFKKGDLAVYCEVDSWIPHSVAPFLTKPGQFPKTYNNVEGQKLKTIRLRGELSQGLLIPLSHETMVRCEAGKALIQRGISPLYSQDELVNQDVTEILGIQKWEAPENPQLSGQSKGSFPSQFPKTDQERIQNLSRKLDDWIEKGLTFTIQEKLEGSSMTCYILNNEFGVCSRNFNLKEDPNNTFWKVARELDIENKMRSCFAEEDLIDGIAIQGELVGPGIQENIYGLTKHTMYVFDIVYAKGMTYLCSDALQIMCNTMNLETVPFLGKIKMGYKLSSNYVQDVQDILELAEDVSVLNPKQEREGLVFKCNQNPSLTFKAISNKYLLSKRED